MVCKIYIKGEGSTYMYFLEYAPTSSPAANIDTRDQRDVVT